MTDARHSNKRCSCGWKTLSFISRDYLYCPMCQAPLEEYDMRKE